MNSRVLLTIALIGALAYSSSPADAQQARPAAERASAPAPQERAAAPERAAPPERAAAPERQSAPDRSTNTPSSNASNASTNTAPDANSRSFPGERRAAAPAQAVPPARLPHHPGQADSQHPSTTTQSYDPTQYDYGQFSSGIAGAQLSDDGCPKPNTHRLFGDLFGRKTAPCKPKDALPSYATPSPAPAPSR